MRATLIISMFTLGTASFLAGSYPGKRITTLEPSGESAIIGCGPGVLYSLQAMDNGKFIVPLPGWGDCHYKISTTSDSTQYYFNQGLTLYYGYHPKEALASFKEAGRFDPDALMPYCGQLLAMGPTYNQAHLYAMPAGLADVLNKADRVLSEGTPKEQDILTAVMTRYPGIGVSATRASLNVAYAAAMRSLKDKYPADADLSMLYVDAVMLVHPWDFWNNDGTSKYWTNELVDITEYVIKKLPEHPAALHYHIHLTEASRHPQVAAHDAEVLKASFPGIAHMVHMASHAYERNGQFSAGVGVNDQADDALRVYHSLAPNLSLSLHLPHYYAVQTYCAMNGAMEQESKTAAKNCRNLVIPLSNDTYAQYLYMFPLLVNVRLGKWADILADTSKPDAALAYAGVLHHFGRGMAFLHMGNTNAAQTELLLLRSGLDDSTLTKRRILFNTALEGANIAGLILEGSLLFRKKDRKGAVAVFSRAAAIEDRMVYAEPRDWPIPSRQILGAWLIRFGRTREAEQVYREDLVWHPGNGWSSLGLYQCLKQGGNKREAEQYLYAAMASFSKATIRPRESAWLGPEVQGMR